MAASLAAYIALPGTVGEAMEHWHDVFGGELMIMRYSGVPPMPGSPFTPDSNAVAHATLTLPGGAGILSGGDAMPDGNDYNVRGSAYSLLYTSETPDDAKTLIAKLVDGGGEEGMPFAQAPWGGWYGQVFDRYGVMWSFSCD